MGPNFRGSMLSRFWKSRLIKLLRSWVAKPEPPQSLIGLMEMLKGLWRTAEMGMMSLERTVTMESWNNCLLIDSRQEVYEDCGIGYSYS